MRHRFLLCLVGIVLLGIPARAADEPADEHARKEVQDVVKRLQARYGKTKDLQADFTQKTLIEGFERPVMSSGKVYLKKPGRLRWSYLNPAVEDIYVNQDEVKVYVPEHKQVMIGKLTQMASSKAPLELLQGAARLDASFEIEPTPGNGKGIGGIRLLTLIPKQNGSESGRTLQRIVVEVFPKTYFIKTVSLYELSGNVSTFEFSAPQANVGMNDDVFELKTPSDVEVVRAPVLSGP